MNTFITTAERELRTTGTLSDATCRLFTSDDEQARRGFEACLAFLGCSVANAPDSDVPVPLDRRVTAVRLMMLRLGIHTSDPRWSSHLLEQLMDAALQPAGAQLSDIVRSFFALLAEAPSGLSDAQVTLIREICIHVVGKQRRRYSAEDFSWLAAMFVDQGAKPTAAQAYLAAYILPPSFASQCRDSILQALHSTRFEEEVKRELE